MKTYKVLKNGEEIDQVVASDYKDAKRRFAKAIYHYFVFDMFQDQYEYLDDMEADHREQNEGLNMRYYIGTGWYTIFTEKKQVFSDKTLGHGFDRFELDGDKYEIVIE